MTNINPSTVRHILQDNLAEGKHPRLVVTSNSMAPLFWAGDQVILKATQPEKLQPGDIITIQDEGGFLTHRVWTITQNGIITCGDHALFFDDVHQSEVVLGQVIGRTHKTQTLNFQEGLGRWLDHHLANLARREHQWLTGSQEPSSFKAKPVHINIGTRIIHHIVFGWAIFITFAISLAARKKSGNIKI